MLTKTIQKILDENLVARDIVKVFLENEPCTFLDIMGKFGGSYKLAGVYSISVVIEQHSDKEVQNMLRKLDGKNKLIDHFDNGGCCSSFLYGLKGEKSKLRSTRPNEELRTELAKQLAHYN